MTRHRATPAGPARNETTRPCRVAGVDAAALVFAALCLASSATTWIAAAVQPPAVALWRFAIPATYVTGGTALLLLAAGLWLATRRRR